MPLRTSGVEDHPEVVRLVLLEDFEEEFRDAPGRRSILTTRCYEWPCYHREEGAVDECVAVDEVKSRTCSVRGYQGNAEVRCGNEWPMSYSEITTADPLALTISIPPPPIFMNS